VLNKNLAQIDLVVFNRWGEKIYETTDWTVGWDGTYKGQKQDVGVYVWECSYRFIGESTIKTAKGNVTLIR
jgi:gliding motility-associated-like protein